MATALALLVSADPTAIQQFSFALQEFSISPDVCREIPEAVRRLNRQKFDALIVDLQLKTMRVGLGRGASLSIKPYRSDICH